MADGDRKRQVTDAGQCQARRGQVTVQDGGQPAPAVGCQPEHHRHREVAQGRPQRALAQASLEVQREGEQQPAVADLGEYQGSQPGRQARRPQHAKVQQRVTAAPGYLAFYPDEEHRDCRTRGQAAVSPGRPAGLLAEYQRNDQQQHRRRRGRQASHVESPDGPRGCLSGCLSGFIDGQAARCQRPEHGPDRHIDREDGPPPLTEQVGADDNAAEHQPGHRATGQHRRVRGQCPCSRPAAEPQLNEAEDLRDEHRRARSLHEPGGDQDGAVWSHRARQRSQGERDDAGQVHAAPSVPVAEPRTGDQQHRVGDRVGTHDQLQFRPGRVQLGADGRHRHVDHEDVEDAHELAEQQHGQHQPAAPCW